DEPARAKAERNETPERIIRARRDSNNSHEQQQEQRQRERHADEPELFTDHGEYEIGVLRGQECEPLLRAERIAFPEPPAGPDGDLRLQHVIPGRARVSRWVEEDEKSALLVRSQTLPQERRNDA